MAIYDEETLISLLRDRKKQYVIPFYQRSYNWTEDNVIKLIDDLVAFRRSLDEDGANMNSKYFVGNIVTKEIKQQSGTLLKRHVVVDGQQRITTTLLIILAIFKIDNINFEDLLECIQVKSNDSEVRLKIDRMNDGQVLKKILQSEAILLPIEKESNLFRNYIFAKKHIEREQLTNELYDALDRTLLFNVILDEKENEKKVFETINSTGLKLSQADLIKNYVFFDSHLFTDIEEKELEYMYSQVESLTETEELSDILRFFIAVNSNEKELPSKRGNNIFTAFRKMIEKNEISLDNFEDAKNLVSKINTTVKYLQIFEQSHENWNMVERFYLQTVKGSINTYTTIYLELMNAFNPDNEKSITVSVLRILSKLIIFRAIADLPEKNITRDVPKMFEHFKKSIAEEKITLGEFERWLEEAEHNYALPNIEEMKLQSKRANYYSNAKKLQQVLKAYELSLISNGSPIDLDWKYSLEHVMPQKFEEKWFPEVEKLSGEHFEISSKIQTLGNFTLLTTSRNSLFSNSSFFDKKRGLSNSDDELGLPFDVLLMNKEFEKMEEWNFETINNRSEKIVNSIYKWFQ